MIDRRAGTLICAVAALLLVATVAERGACAEEIIKKEEPQYLRVAAEKGRFVALEIAVVPLTGSAEESPMVSLVGVTHIGEKSYYDALQELLGGFDVVLYESVKPAGTGGAGGDTPEQRIETTKAAMRFATSLIEAYRDRRGEYPPDLDALRKFAETIDPRLAGYLDDALIDAWDRSMTYRRPSSECGGDPVHLLVSFGADGVPGGEGEDADVSSAQLVNVHPLEMSAEDNIQLQLAEALGLAFQLDALDYGSPNWRCSDMSMDQLQQALDERGLDFTIVGDMLDGSSLPAQIARFLLGMVRLADALTEGAVSDTIKVLLIELLGDEAALDMSLDQLGEGFSDVIICQRNQIVIDELKRIIEREEPVESVAVLYGAGHMSDLANRLHEQLGYQSAKAHWLRAIKVDLTASVVSEQQVMRIRIMVRRMMRQMQQMNRAPG